MTKQRQREREKERETYMLEKGKTIDPDFGRETDDVLWFSASLGF